MKLYENVATQAIVSFFYYEPLWKKEILFNFLLKPFSSAYEDVQDVVAQDNLKGTIPDFTIVLKNSRRIRFEVKTGNVGLTVSEYSSASRDAFLVCRDYAFIDSIPLENDKILFWEDLFAEIDRKGASKEFYRLTLVREAMRKTYCPLFLTPYEVAMLYSPEKISAVYSLSEKVLRLCEGFLNSCTERYEKTKKQQDIYGIGYYFKDRQTGIEYFVGISPTVSNAEYSFSVAMLLDGKSVGKEEWYTEQDYAYFSLEKDILAKHGNDEDLQAAFNANVKSVLKEIC